MGWIFLLLLAAILLAVFAFYVTRTRRDGVDASAAPVTEQAGAAAVTEQASAAAVTEQVGAEAESATARNGAAANAGPWVPPPSLAEQLEVCRRALEADAPALERYVTDAAAAGDTFAVETYLARHAELDPAAAVRLARWLRLDPGLIAELHKRWAAADVAAALADTGTLTDPRAAAQLALATLDVLGYGEEAVERVAAAVAETEAPRVRVEALAALARSAPAAALERALELEDAALAARALARVCDVWAAIDPAAAVSALRADPRARRRALAERALALWARADPEGLLRHLRTVDPMDEEPALLGAALVEMARVLPLAVIELTDVGSPPPLAAARRSAIQQLAEQDPGEALERAEALPPGPDRRQWMRNVALGCGRSDVDAALTWAGGLESPPPGVLAAVVQGVVDVDPHRALDVALQVEPAAERAEALRVVVQQVAPRGELAGVIANRLVALGGSTTAREALSCLLRSWALQEPEAALDWLLAHDDAGAEAYAVVARQLARRDPRGAASLAEQVPDEVRSAWLAQVGRIYAGLDPDGACSWLESRRRQPVYQDAVLAVARQLASREPARAARLLRGVSLATAAARTVAAALALAWAQREPAVAAAWALGLDDPQARSTALTDVLRRWTRQNRQQARAWVLRLPAGSRRDTALRLYVSAVAEAGQDMDLLEAFRSESAREQALVALLFPVALRDAREARVLIDRHIVDPALLRRAEEVLASARREQLHKSMS